MYICKTHKTCEEKNCYHATPHKHTIECEHISHECEICENIRKLKLKKLSLLKRNY